MPDIDHQNATKGVRSRIPKASTMLANELRGTIIRERLEEGAPLPSEIEIIERSGLSRATVRESLRLLEAEGLVVARRGPGGGLRVGRPDLQAMVQAIAAHLALSEATLGDLLAFRRLVEREAARLAALHATPDQRRSLRDSVSSSRPPLTKVIGFHELVAEATGNEFFRVFLKILLSLAEWHTPNEGLHERDIELARSAHGKVASRIIARDADGAAEAMDVHLKAFEDFVRQRGNIDQAVIRSVDWSTGAPILAMDLFGRRE